MRNFSENTKSVSVVSVFFMCSNYTELILLNTDCKFWIAFKKFVNYV